ncbi:hypothetical protein SVIOM342S_03589 [Streptomyces violaceorubidus]
MAVVEARARALASFGWRLPEGAEQSNGSWGSDRSYDSDRSGDPRERP